MINLLKASRSVLVASALAAATASGTGCSPGGASTTVATDGGGTQQSQRDTQDGQDERTEWQITLFSVGQNHGLAAYDDPAALDGVTIEPDQALATGAATVSGPRDIAMDARGALYISSSSDDSIAIYDNPLTAGGQRPPSRRISGPSTELETPGSLTVDQDNDELYVVTSFGRCCELRVYDISAPDAFDGDVAPARRFTVGDTAFIPIQVVFAGGSLYVSDQRAQTLDIFVFDDPGSLEGAVTPDRVISDDAIESMASFHVDAADRLIVTNRGNDPDEIMIWYDASTLDGSPAPAAIITVDGVNGVLSLEHAVTDSLGRLYTIDFNNGGAIYSFDDVDDLVTGAHLPDRVFSAQASGFGRLLVWERY